MLLPLYQIMALLHNNTVTKNDCFEDSSLLNIQLSNVRSNEIQNIYDGIYQNLKPVDT